VTADVSRLHRVDMEDTLRPWLIPLICMLVGIAGRIAVAGLAGKGWLPDQLVHAYCKWDCSHYMAIAGSNYETGISTSGSANWPFFPMLPAVTALLHLTGLSLESAGTLAATLASLVAARLAYGLCTTPRQYLLFCAAVSFGPAALYFTIPYSESLFLLFTVVLQRALARGRYIGAGIAGALLSATRLAGIFAGVSLLLTVLVQFRSRGRPWRDLPKMLWAEPAALLGLALVPLGLGVFVVTLYLRMGDGLAFLHAQRLWYRDFANPITAVWDGLAGSSGEDRIKAIAALLGLAGAAVLLRQRQYAIAAFTGLCILAPLMTGLESMYRFVVTLAPLWLVLTAGLAQRRWSTVLGLVALFVTGLYTNMAWLNGAHTLV